jgi:hypothetical protein
VSARSAWKSQSTYKSDYVSKLPSRPSNGSAYLFILFGAFGLFLAWQVGTNAKDSGVLAGVIAVSSVLFLLAGFGARKRPEQLASAQAAWDKTWSCARCGHQWQQ